ncbi:hypothetical protein MTR67_001739 [Solanum verrucosum]|uniref:Reverse transcriptase/retrotransposon-derived protein RNase H-like domain-containing protein n=1 Tax=Solanum verrucosum TaxID=315347 RepID=A0AAF0PNS6_SOLVR|nr:hypothetical protein MTR67_001739 [Solanum verrucosum]
MAFHSHIVSGKGIEVDPQKADAVKNWPGPLFLLDIQNLLGDARYNRRFMEWFSSTASLLTTLTQNKVKFLCSEACDKSFQELKNRVTSPPVLTVSEGSDVFVVYCDASRIGLGYHLGKANVVADALNQLLMSSAAHVEDDEIELVHDVHRLVWLGVHLVYSDEGGDVVQNGLASSFVGCESETKSLSNFG